MRNQTFTFHSSTKAFDINKKTLTLFFMAMGVLFITTLALNNFTPGNFNVVAMLPATTAPTDTIPEVQVFIPGYSVKQIPVSLNNINTLKYGDDGRLYALGYNGHIYVLTDTDGDGLEDKSLEWWGEKSTIAAPVSMAVTPAGIYVTGKNKIVLVKDTNKDGTADIEEIVTRDWTQPVVFTGTTEGGVDSFGIAKDKDGNIYFALGNADFTRAYLVDSVNKSHYNIKGERGTIIKVKAGTSTREIYCTGTRFPVAMDFNENNDLFASDQEGATWLANGNPLDELLYIQPDRHYGFPPRHPKYLPDVIDEPSVFDYGPQHQSTCGLHFNLPVNGGPVFGPAWTYGNAIVSGYSRGKIYRTRLVKTAAGYVAANDLIASVAHLTVDAAVSPKGDLVVSTHSGPPDWGYGAAAKGKLFKIIPTAKDLPAPVAIWASKPDQLKVAFDRPVPKSYLANLAENIKIEYGQYVAAGDRFEVWRPGYQAVEQQRSYPRFGLAVKNADLADDGRTLIINTDTQIQPMTYGITLPAFAADKKMAGSIAQAPVMDLAYNLNGVDVSWQSGNSKWLGTIPHLDLAVSSQFLKPTGDYAGLEKSLNTPGKVTFKTKLNLYNMLRPNIQPGSTIDYSFPPEDVTLTFNSSDMLEIKAAGAIIEPSVKQGDAYITKVTFKQVERKPYDLEIAATSNKRFALNVTYSTAEDARPRALQVNRFFAPWLKDIFNSDREEIKDDPKLAGGNWAKGKKLFFGEALCSTCHNIGGKGKSIGPDLSNLVFRDYNSVLRDIHDPNASINPDYAASTITLKNKKLLEGMLSYKKDSVIVKAVTGVKTSVALKDIVSTKPLNRSLMYPGLDIMLGPQKMKDLLTFLLTNVSPARYEHIFLPPIRSSAEVNELLRNSADAPFAAAKSKAVKGKTVRPKVMPVIKTVKPFRILWVSGPKDHGADEHDYPLQQQRWSKLLSLAEDVTVTKANAWPTQQQFDNADVVVFYWNYQKFTEENGKQLDAFQQRGGGLVYLHYAVDATENPAALANRIGLAWKGGAAKFRHGRLDLQFTPAAATNPVTKGFKKPLVLEDESYWQLTPGSRKIDVLATNMEDGQPQPMVWSSEAGKGRVFVSIMGHYNWTFDDPLFRELMFRGISWSGHQPLNRFDDVITMGARMSK